MPDSGFKGGTFAHAEISSVDVDGTAVADNGSITTDTIDNSVATPGAGITVSVGVVEDNTGAIDGVVTVGAFGSDFDPDSEGFQIATDPFWSFTFTPVQNLEVTAAPFFVEGTTYPKFKVYLLNESGQELAVTINLIPITIPVAS